MTVPHPFRRAVAIAAACAALAMGLVALVTSQSQPARAASVGEFTLTPGTGKLSDAQPIAGSLKIPGKCPDVTVEDLNWNSVLALYVVKADKTEAQVMNGITHQAPYTAATTTISLAATDNPGMAVNSLANAITGDGTYELRVRCMDNFDWAVPPDSYVPGDPYWSQKITVSGDNWQVGEGAQATSVTMTADDATPEPGQKTKLIATVAPAGAAGTVTFVEGTTTIGQAPVTGGKAEFETATLTEGQHDVVARFTPTNSAEWGASESGPYRLHVQLPRFEMHNAAGERLPTNPQLERGQKVKVVIRGCTPNAKYSMELFNNDTEFPDATADASGTVTWQTLTVPEDATAGQTRWDYSPDCTNTPEAALAVEFTLAEPSSESPSSSPSDDPSGDPSDDPSDDTTDAPTGEPTDGTSGDTTSGTTGGDSGSTGTSGGSTTGGTSAQGGLASTGSQIALFSGVGAVVLCAAGVFLVRYGRRNGLLKFGEPGA